METSLKKQRDIAVKFRVAMYVEMFREITVSAQTEEQAREFAENRVRLRNKVIENHGYTIGDIEFINVEELKE